jgi:DNA-binding beta-propeller fold protein YncE
LSTTGNLTMINLTTDTAGTPIAVGKNPQAVAISPDGTTAWVVCYDSQTLVPVSTKTHLPGTAIHLAGGPYALAVVSRELGPGVTSTTTAKVSGGKKKKKA